MGPLATSSDWIWDATRSAYYHAPSGTYALPNDQGIGWRYMPSTHPGSSTLEEGEVTEDVGWGPLIELEGDKVDSHSNGQAETPETSLRLVVSKSEVCPVGHVAMIDPAMDGGVQLGRDRKDGELRLRVKEMEVSKTHAVVYCKDGDWWVVDLGSTHGTFLRHVDDEESTRLSEAKQSSKPHSLRHLSTITLGGTKLTAHIHPGWPCDLCQVTGSNALPLEEAPAQEEKALYVTDAMRDTREARHQKEMAKLRQTYLKEDSATDTKKNRYLDRSAIRRQAQRASPRRRSVSPTSNTPPPGQDKPVSTVAHQMLAQQGWTPGRGLGVSENGIAQPIQVNQRSDRRGLGVDNDMDWKELAKQKRWRDAG